MPTPLNYANTLTNGGTAVSGGGDMELPSRSKYLARGRFQGCVAGLIGEEQRLKQCIKRGCPFGDDNWVKMTVRRLGIESTLRPKGRPRKLPK